MEAQNHKLLESIKKLQEGSLKKPIEALLQMGLPSKKSTGFSYFSLDKLYQESFDFSKQSDCLPKSLPELKTKYRFVFIDGLFYENLSTLEDLSDLVVFMPFDQAKKEYEALTKVFEEKFLSEQREHGLDFLCEAFYEKGFFFYVPPKTVIEDIEFLFLGDLKDVGFSKNLLYLGKESNVKIRCNYISRKKQLLQHAFYLSQEPMSHCEIVSDFTQIKQTWCFHKISSKIKKGATLKLLSVDFGSLGLFKEIKVDLLDEMAFVDTKGISLLSKKENSHQVVKISHLKENTQSNQHFKNLLLDESKASFDGKIWVDPIAQKTVAYQLCNQLLLSKQAQCFAKPNLEIFADDVKASHGATISNLDEEALFYLNSRGISKGEGKKILVKAFAKEILQDLPQPIEKEFFEYLQTILSRETNES